MAPGDFRTVNSLGFTANTGNGDGRPSGFNDLGQLGFFASFTDGSQGIFVSNLVAIPDPPIDADFDDDSDVDGNDFLIWQRGVGLTGVSATNPAGNANGDQAIDGDDLDVWSSHFGPTAMSAADAPVPEPSPLALASLAGALAIAATSRRR